MHQKVVSVRAAEGSERTCSKRSEGMYSKKEAVRVAQQKVVREGGRKGNEVNSSVAVNL